jgi:biotin carboxyl carrier protein
VAASDVIGLIEVMKSFHEIQAGVDGKAVAFLVEDGDAVMAGQVLAEVEQ